MTQLDLLAYPNTPGYKAPGPSAEAAEAMKPSAATLRAEALQVIKHRGDGLTADEVAEIMHESPFSIRPRVAELNALGLVKNSGDRRRNRSGRDATVWVAIW